MAELFLLASARKLKAPYSTPNEAANAIASWWKRKLPQVPWQGFVAENGSGLSPHARLSPSQAVGILQWADRRRYDGRSYLSLLPISGMKGTLHTRLANPQTALRVWAKTGTMKYGTSLAGYFFSKENRKHVFAIFVSDLEKRRALDEAAASDPKAFRKLSDAGEAWIDRGRKLQDAMLTKWVTEN